MAFRWILALGVMSNLLLAEDYVLGPDSQRQPGVPSGAVTKHSWTSLIYPGTTRDYWIYAPAQYDAARPACVMVFQDGGGMVTETGGWRVPIVLDNLIHKKELPVTIAVFINPGVLPALTPSAQQNRYNRSYEYDGLGDRYARFLIEEILPEVGKKFNLSKDPNDYALAGSSSGGIAAFNAAWNRPDKFRRVASFIGSFTNLRGGDTLASHIRKTEPKPLRIFLQDGRADQDIYSGNWFLANQEIDSSLRYAGYESTFVIGTEGHNGKHGGAILPDALRWLWKDYPKSVSKATKLNERGLYTFFEPGTDWERVTDAFHLTADSTVDKEGNVYFTHHDNNRIYKVDAQNKLSVWKENSGGAHGIAFGPDGRLYAGQHDRKRLVAFAPDGKEAVIAEGVQTHHLTVTARNEVYFAEAPKHLVWMVDGKGKKRVVHDRINWPKGIHASTDQSLVVINDPNTKWVWSFQAQPDGSLIHGQPFYHLETPDETGASDAGGMTFDTDGYLYVATAMGVQICDQAGRVNAILNPPPGSAGVTDAFFAGPNLQWLYVSDGSKLFRRPMKHRGAPTWQAIKPPQPRM
jgi:enterochelin esterase-like enzyme/sugar lactone lactonase YvrE